MSTFITPRGKLTPEEIAAKHHSDEVECAERVTFCYEMLRAQKPKRDIKEGFRRKFTPEGKREANAKTIEKYISEAKALILADAADGKEILTAQAYATYTNVLNSETAEHRDRIAAQARIDKLFGLEAPTKIAPTTPDGLSAYENLTIEQIDERIRLAERALQSQVSEA